MKKLIAIIIGAVLLGNSAYSQKGSWTIGVTTGLRGEYCFSSDWLRNYWSGRQISIPMAKFYFGYSLIDNLQLESGLAYVENQSSYGIGTFFWGMGKGLNSDQRLLYSALQIPLHLKYTLPFKKSGLGMFFHAGIDLSIPLQRYKESSYMLQEHPEYKGSGDDYFYLMRSEYEVDVLAPKKIINCLVNAGIGFVYQFKCGIGVSIYTEYYSGLVDMARIRLQAETTVYETNGSKYTRLDPPQYIVFRGDYWHAGLGVSYTFKRKEKP